MPKPIADCLQRPLVLFLSAAIVFASLASANASEAKIQDGFQARDLNGSEVALSSDLESQRLTVIAFLGAECPMAKIYGPRLNKLQQEFGQQRLRVIGINSNSQDSFADVTEYAKVHGIEFEFLRDANHVIADQFQATRTPEVFLLDSQLQLLYHGRFDDQYFPGVTRSAPTRADLKIAITEALAGKPVAVAETNPTGCVIGRAGKSTAVPAAENSITYAEHVIPLLQKHCIECHRAGEIGPFEMTDYVEVAGWADTMLETIDNGRMPPWHAEPGVGNFHNARSMPESDRQLFRDWIAGGLKPGAIESQIAAKPTEVANTDFGDRLEGWPLPEPPDMIVEMRNRPFVVSADGIVEYQYFVADLGLTEDRWIKAARVIPGARSVVHHAIVFIRPPDGGQFRGVGLLAAYVPGQQFVPLPDGAAQKIVAGSQLVFQMHYTPNGSEQPDTSSIAIAFADEKDVTDEVYTLIALEQEFEIPPRTANHLVSAKLPWFPKNGRLLSVAPHMHYRGKSFQLHDKTGRPLLSVPNYDFNWQHTYAYRNALPFSDIGQLQINVGFDNSSDNPFNPNPNEWVTWGDQTWEEMAVAFFQVSEPRASNKNASKNGNRNKAQPRTKAQMAKRQEKIDRYVARALSKMDANQDGQIARSETSVVVRHFNFDDFDHDGNGIATKEELIQTAKSLYGK
ncbi:MAG: redoxin domain-containing protein [Fuerstiella sp.]